MVSDSLKIVPGQVLGVGYIFKTRKVIFTASGTEIGSADLPQKLANKLLYPAISLASREQHKIEINLGLKKFIFDINGYIKKTYYKSIHSQIQNFKVKNPKIIYEKMEFHKMI